MRTRKANINSREFLALESFFWSPRVLLCGSSGADVTAESASSWTTRPQGDTHIHTHTHDSNHHELTQKPTTRTQVSRRQTPVSKPRYITRSQRNALHPRRQTKFPPTTHKTHAIKRATNTRTTDEQPDQPTLEARRCTAPGRHRQTICNEPKLIATTSPDTLTDATASPPANTIHHDTPVQNARILSPVPFRVGQPSPR